MVLAFATLALGWGGAWPMMKLLLVDFPPLTLRGASAYVGLTGLLVYIRIVGAPMSVPRHQWRTLIHISLLNISGWLAFTVYGVTLMNASHGIIIAYTMPAWTALFAALALGDRLDRRTGLALLCGMAGVALLFAPGLPAVAAHPLGAGLVLCAAVSWAVGTVLTKQAGIDLPLPSLLAWQIAIGAAPLLLIGLMTEPMDWGAVGPAAWGRFTLFALYPLCLCYVIWFWSLRRLPATVAAIGGLMTPVAGVLTSALFIGEPLGLGEIGALALIVSAAGLALLRRQPA
jgi:drug/metabolite transporter (DMT)-like permease